MIEYYKQLAEVVEWQTRRTQNPLMATSCGFKSRLRHQYNKKTVFITVFLLYVTKLMDLNGRIDGQREDKTASLPFGIGHIS